LSRLTATNTLVLVNKSDLVDAAPQVGFLPELRHVEVSALSGLGLESVRAAIAELADGLAPQMGEEVVAINARHAHSLGEARAEPLGGGEEVGCG